MGSTFESGAIIAGRYRLEAPLGEGGFGAVWKAVQLNLNRPVAIKLLKTTFDDGARRRFEREATALGRLQHPGCVQMLDFGFDDGAFLVTELLDGERLDVWLKSDPPLPERLRVAAQVLDTLAYAHQQNIIHRDLKPPNIIIVRTFDGVVAKVLDFGIASIVGEQRGDITKTGEVFGTPGFMSPEQLRGDATVGPAADLYAFGVVLYQMLEGRPPFEGKAAMHVAVQHLAQPAPRVTAAVPPALADLVAKLLEKEPEARFPSAQATLRALAAIEFASTPPAQVSTWAPPPDHGARFASGAPVAAISTEIQPPVPRRGAWLVAGAAGVLAVGFGAWLALRDQAAEPVGASPVRAQNASGLLRAEADDPAPFEVISLATPDAGAADVHERDASTVATAPVGHSAGCGVEAAPGLQRLSWTSDNLENHVARVYVPRGYSAERAHPAVMLFHDSMQTPQTVLKESRFTRLADEHGIVVVLPEHATPVYPWAGRKPKAYARKAFEIVLDSLCIDQSRMYLWGHGAGGKAAEALRCSLPGVAAVATSAFRLDVDDDPCARDVPYLHLAPLDDGRDPVDGGVGCLGGAEMRTLDANDALYRAVHRCGDDRKVESRPPDGTCYTWDCEVPFVSCRIDGGRPLAGSPETVPCEGRRSKFPHAEKVWSFFEAHPRSVE